MVAILLAQPEDTGALLRFVQQPRHWIDLEEGEKVSTTACCFCGSIWQAGDSVIAGSQLLWRCVLLARTILYCTIYTVYVWKFWQGVTKYTVIYVVIVRF